MLKKLGSALTKIATCFLGGEGVVIFFAPILIHYARYEYNGLIKKQKPVILFFSSSVTNTLKTEANPDVSAGIHRFM